MPLMRHEISPEEILAKCVERIAEAPVEWQADLYLGLAVFSSLKFTKEVILKMIEVSKMETSPLFDGIREKWIDQGIQQGIQKGIQQGIQKGIQQGIRWMQDAIIDVLEENVGCCPEGLANELRAIQDIETLKVLHRKAVKAKTLDKFMQAFNEMLRKNN